MLHELAFMVYQLTALGLLREDFFICHLVPVTAKKGDMSQFTELELLRGDLGDNCILKIFIREGILSYIRSETVKHK